MLTAFGWTQLEMSFDIPALESDPSKTPAVLWNMWQGVVAAATTDSTQLAYIEYVNWKSGGAAGFYSGLPLFGLHFGRSAPRAHCCTIVQHTGHDDDYSARRVFLAGMPSSWTDGQVLTADGWDAGMALAHAWAMGIMASYCGGDSQLLIAYPHILPVVPENLQGVAFRRVASLRVCHYVAKAPDISLGLWP